MLDLSKILVIIEPDTDKQPALQKAKQLAKYADAELELMIADYNAYMQDGFYFDPLQAQKLRYEHSDRRSEELEALAKPLREQGLEVTVRTRWGNPPYGEIVKHVRDSKPSLVIKSTRHHSKLARVFLSNEDWELVRYCPAPLLLAKTDEWAAHPNIIAAVDPDHIYDKPADLDNKLIASARTLATLAEGEVHLFHSAWIPPMAGVYALIDDSRQERQKVKELASANDLSESVCHLSNGEIRFALPDLVEELKASLVVMGAVSRSRMDRIMIGSTAEKVLDRLDCDVLVIKPDDIPTAEHMEL